MSKYSDKTEVIVLSGGMDSTTLLWERKAACNQVGDLLAISFDYGQKHRRPELACARKQCLILGIDHEVIDLRSMAELFESALTTPEVTIPEGHYAADNMKLTVVPNRNAIMLNIATGVAISCGAHSVFTAVHGGDHHIYSDCRPGFIMSLNNMVRIANEGYLPKNFSIEAPFILLTKNDIVGIGHDLGVDWTRTWSCYNGRKVHCGLCGTCVERRLAFLEAGVVDPTEYEVPLTDKQFLTHAFKDIMNGNLFYTEEGKNLQLRAYAKRYGLL